MMACAGSSGQLEVRLEDLRMGINMVFGKKD
jgi:hypothetical protein